MSTLKAITLVVVVIILVIIGFRYMDSQPDNIDDNDVVASDSENQDNTNDETVVNENNTTDQIEGDVVVLETEMGNIEIELLPELAPNHANNFKKLASEGFYDGTKFHRVVPGFMIQGGDPNTKTDNRAIWGTGGPGYTIDAEFSSEPHVRGIVSMARSNDPNSAGSQFFIVVDDSNFLDNQYTVFGRVLSGMEVADQIVSVPAEDEIAINPIEITRAVVK